jgi:hypothetical protein
MAKQQTKEIDGLQVTVVKFAPTRGYKLMGRLQKDGMGDPVFMRDMLALTSVIRADANGDLENISLAGGDAALDKAFADAGVYTMVKALEFALEVNFKDFLDAHGHAAKSAAGSD